MTVTLTLALLPPAVAVIVAVPAFTADTYPVPVTEATDASDELHVTVLLVAFDGLTVADSWADLPFSSDNAPLDTPEPEIATDDTGTSGVLQVTADSVVEEPSHWTAVPRVNSSPGAISAG